MLAFYIKSINFSLLNLNFTDQRCDTGELEKTCCEHILHIKSAIKSCDTDLRHGTISVRDLKMLMKRKEIFLSLAQILEFSVPLVEKALACRTDQLQAFSKMMSTLQTLNFFCKDITSGKY